MLVASPRHTTQDLELWHELEIADLARPEPEAKARSAIDAIREFSRSRKCYVSCSAGKDSAVVLDLVRRSGARIPVVHISSRQAECPESPATLDLLRSAGIQGEEWHDVPHDVDGLGDATWEAVTRDVQRRFGARVVGIRSGESKIRRIRFLTSGAASRNSLWPIATWTTDEVFSYLAHRELPAHPNYAMLGGGRWDRAAIRVDFLGEAPGRCTGRAEWELEYYPDEVRRLEASLAGAPSRR